MIKEYYLHLFGGVNGENDAYTGAGRLIIAALMAGYGLQASTKKDLQTRIGWQVTPGCFLGQKEVSIDRGGHSETILAASLLQCKKLNRMMNYQLDWTALDDELDYRVSSSVWVVMAKIYWLGKFLFGFNVIPQEVLNQLRQRFNPSCNTAERGVLKSHFVMQFLKDIGIPVATITNIHLFTESETDVSRFDLFLSFLVSLNSSENVPGFYALAAAIPHLIPVGTSFDQIDRYLQPLTQSQVGRALNRQLPLCGNYYSTLGLGRPNLPNSLRSFPSEGRNIVPLLFANTELTPLQMSSYNYAMIRGEGFNTEYLHSNVRTYMVSSLLWELHLFLTGEELFPLSALANARHNMDWSPEDIISSFGSLNPGNYKNNTIAQLIRFNLQRQEQV